MFKIVLIHILNNLSDEQTEYVIGPSIIHMASGIGLFDCVPDTPPIWLSREHLTQASSTHGLDLLEALLRNRKAEKMDLRYEPIA